MKNSIVISIEVARLFIGHPRRDNGLFAVVMRGVMTDEGVEFKERFYYTSVNRVAQLAALLAAPQRPV